MNTKTNTNTEFKKLKDLTKDEIKQLTVFRAQVFKRNFKNQPGASYSLTLPLIPGLCDLRMQLTQEQYFNILIKSDVDLNVNTAVSIGVYGRLSKGIKKDNTIYYCCEIIINSRLRYAWILNDLQVENINSMIKRNPEKYSFINWLDRGAVEVEDLALIQEDME